MEKVRDYELKAFFNYVINVLEMLEIPYMVVGGFAAILHGAPRMTLDVDIVVDMQQRHVSAFVAAFPSSDFYADEEDIRDSLSRRRPFNVIHSTTGAKVDLIPLPRDLFTRAAFPRRQRLEYDEFGHSADFIAAEDIVLAKLIAFQKTESDKHLLDARGVLAAQWENLNLDAIRIDARAAGVDEQLESLLESARAVARPGQPDEENLP